LSDYTKLQVFHKAYQFSLDIYKLTTSFPADERYGLMSQMRRAAVSIPANLAEGSGRESTKALLQFTRIALGSAYESRVYLALARDLQLITLDVYNIRHDELLQICRMLNSMISGLQRKIKTSNSNYQPPITNH
jgi:four helix bundle protein